MREKRIGKSENNAVITICSECVYADTPHFNYRYGGHRQVSIFFDRPMLVDSMENLELSDRRDLQKFLTPQNWEKMIRIWNQNNESQISSSIHIPFYMNLQQYQDKAIVTTKEESNRLGAVLYVGTEDQDQRPHFHYKREDKSEVAISLLKPEYLVQTEDGLEDNEIDELVSILSELNHGESLFQRLVICWNDQNHTQADETRAMPSYGLMKKSSICSR